MTPCRTLSYSRVETSPERFVRSAWWLCNAGCAAQPRWAGGLPRGRQGPAGPAGSVALACAREEGRGERDAWTTAGNTLASWPGICSTSCWYSVSQEGRGLALWSGLWRLIRCPWSPPRMLRYTHCWSRYFSALNLKLTIFPEYVQVDIRKVVLGWFCPGYSVYLLFRHL